MKKAIRPASFKGRQTEPELILCAVRWYLRYSLSFRDVEELLSERGQGGRQHRPGTSLRLSDFRNEKRRNPAALLPASAGPILEQHPGAGSTFAS